MAILKYCFLWQKVEKREEGTGKMMISMRVMKTTFLTELGQASVIDSY